MKTKPDFMLVVLAAFGLGLAATMLLPMTTSSSVAAPASALQAGVIQPE